MADAPRNAGTDRRDEEEPTLGCMAVTDCVVIMGKAGRTKAGVVLRRLNIGVSGCIVRGFPYGIEVVPAVTPT